MLRATVKKLFSHSMIYSVTWISNSAVGIILLPVYTRYLTEADYGILEILAYTNEILSLLMIAGVHNGLAKFYNDQTTELGRKRVISSGFTFVVLSGLVGCSIAMVFRAQIAASLLGGVEYQQYIKMNVYVLFAQLVSTILYTWLVVSKLVLLVDRRRTTDDGRPSPLSSPPPYFLREGASSSPPWFLRGGLRGGAPSSIVAP